MMKRVVAILILVCTFTMLPLTIALAGSQVSADDSFKSLKADYPLVARYMEGSHVARLYGQAFAHGSSPETATADFVSKYAGIFDALPQDLYPVNYLPDGRRMLPLMYDRSTGEYKFTLVYFTQMRGGIPVFMGDLRLLVRNQPDNPVVLASSGLRNLGDFNPVITSSVNKDLARDAVDRFYGALTNIDEPELVIWAGVGDMVVNPVLAMEFTADNGKVAQPDYEKWRFLIDAQTGDILYTENEIVDIDVTGNVSGMATEGNRADFCNEEVLTPMPYVRVTLDGGSPVYTDENGDFTIPNDGFSEVTIDTQVRGQWFNVYNAAGANAELSLNVVPPGPANFIFNELNDNQYTRAEVNGYIHANVIRDFALQYHPTYPVIYQQQGFTVNVNINENCNAYYDGYSINFFTAGGGCSNTAFSTVIHHEYGHHLVNVGGSQQGAYGEGIGDVVGILTTDDPGLAYGFFNQCGQYMRTGDNNFQYPCSGEIHYCGQLISGCVWSTRNALYENYPDTYLDIIANLSINSIPLHRGSDINPDITVDFLTLDDDDNDIWNGTPHGLELIQGFVFEHAMDFGVVPQITHTPLMDNEDPNANLTVDANVTSFFSMDAGNVTVHYSTGGDFQAIEMNHISGNNWQVDIPRPDYGTTINYYIEAIDEMGVTAFSPENAPEEFYTFYFGADIIPPTMTMVDFPDNTVNLFGPYGPFVITAWDVHGVNDNEIVLHYRVNDETEQTVNLSPSGNDNEFALGQIDLDRQLESGDVVNCYFTAYDEANTPNQGRLPGTGYYELLMADAEVFEDFEEFEANRWTYTGDWEWATPGNGGGHALTYGPSYPLNVNDPASMDFGYDLSPYSAARITLYHRNALLGGDTCFVRISNDGGVSWNTVGAITGYPGSSFYYDEYDISSSLDPGQHDYRIGFMFSSDGVQQSGILKIDDIGWAIGPMTGIVDNPDNLPVELALGQNYPNPFNPQTNIYFELPSRSDVTLDIFDVLGRKIASLVDEQLDAGSYSVIWDGRDNSGNMASSGIYFYRLSTDLGVRQAKMTLLK